MANWASTSYAIEGSKETLLKIEYALNNPTLNKDEGDSDGWEGGVLRTLGIEWEEHNIQQKGNEVEFSGYYMRGFIRNDVEPWYTDAGTLRFDAEEAWGLTDFYKVLENGIPNIKVYWIVEEPGEDVYATNDKEGKYFPDRFYVDTCIDSNYQSEYFITEEAMYKWLSELTKGEIKTLEEAEDFNTFHEEKDDEDYISIHKFDIME